MYNTSQSRAEESDNIDHEDNLADEDSTRIWKQRHQCYANLDLKLLTKDGQHCMTMKVH